MDNNWQKQLAVIGGSCFASFVIYSSYKLYDDYKRKRIKSIRNLQPGERAAIEGRVRRMESPT